MRSPEKPFDPDSPAMRECPYPALGVLRERDPVHWAGNGLWVVTRMQDAKLVLKDVRFERDFDRMMQFTQDEPSTPRVSTRVMRQWAVNLDPPDHGRVRAHLVRAISSKRMRALEAPARSEAARLVEASAAAGGMDLIGGLAFPLTAKVICLLLELPAHDHALFTNPASSLIPEPGLLDAAHVARSDVDQADAKIEHALDYFRHLLEHERRHPKSGFIADLLAGQRTDPLLDDDCILAQLYFMFFAGHQTTQAMIGNALHCLLALPEQASSLRNDPTRLRGAVEELTRFDSSTQTGNLLRAREDIKLAGRLIRRGEHVIASIGAANRDPRATDMPDELDLGRTGVAHLSYGYGAHYCIGAMLAAIEVRVALEAVLLGLPDDIRIAPPGPDDWLPTLTLRGLRRLRATWTPRAADHG